MNLIRFFAAVLLTLAPFATAAQTYGMKVDVPGSTSTITVDNALNPNAMLTFDDIRAWKADGRGIELSPSLLLYAAPGGNGTAPVDQNNWMLNSWKADGRGIELNSGFFRYEAGGTLPGMPEGNIVPSVPFGAISF